MAYIRALEKLPSGIDGWYIYKDSNKNKLYISSPEHGENYHSPEDIVYIRDILNRAIQDYGEEIKARCTFHREKKCECEFVAAGYSWASGYGNPCCAAIPDGERTRVCKTCYGQGVEFFGGK